MSRHHRTMSGSRWHKVRASVLAQAGGVCQINTAGVCTGLADQVDHIVPLSAGGHPYDEQNLRAACRACNLDRLARTPKVHNPWGV